MNPLGIFAVIVALVAGYYGISESDIFPSFGFGSFGGGPIATGPGRGAEVENPQPAARGFFGFGGVPSAPPPAAVPLPGESPFKGKVTIVRAVRSGEDPSDEHVTIRYGGGFFGLFRQSSAGDQPVNVTGWSIASRRSSVTIPRAYNIPEIDAVEQDIILPAGGQVNILTGTPAYQKNFRENDCTGYLNEFYEFTPSLSNSCADSRPNRGELLARGFNGECIEVIEDVPACRVPRGPFQAGVIGSECIDYMNRNLNYAGCVANFRDRRDFLGDTWRVSLRRPSKLFDPLHDRVVLRDRQGLLVDEFEY